MAEFLTAIWETWKPGPNALIWLLFLSPFLIWSGVLLFQFHFRGDVTPPQQEKILRPPGYSLQLKLDDLWFSIPQTLAISSFMLLTATFAVICGIAFFRANSAPGYVIIFAALFTVSIIPALALLGRAFHQTTEARNARLGLRGEQAVAEVLHELADSGYRAFHDFETDANGNIDHVIVGTSGVFLIETKARCRRPSKRGQPKHVVVYDGRALIFPSGTDTKAVAQTERNTNWLADYLAKKTCEPVPVEPIIVVPGWYTESKGSFPVKLMNTNYLKTFLRKQSSKIDPAQVRRIIAALDEKCRTLEF